MTIDRLTLSVCKTKLRRGAVDNFCELVSCHRNFRNCLPIMTVLILTGCSPIGIRYDMGGQRKANIDNSVFNFGGVCDPENLRILGHNPPPCAANGTLAGIINDYSTNDGILKYLEANNFECNKMTIGYICRYEKYFDTQPYVINTPEYPITRNTYRVSVTFNSDAKSGDLTKTNVEIRRTILR
jgi:hypothetical protein